SLSHSLFTFSSWIYFINSDYSFFLLFFIIIFFFFLSLSLPLFLPAHNIAHTNTRIVCLDCAGNYTKEELDLSLIILSLILSFFLLVLCAQCISRFRARFYPESSKGIPAPPYIRRRYSYT